MPEAFICDAIRTPIGRYGGALSSVRADDLAAAPITALRERNPGVDWEHLDDVFLGCANQTGEDNRNVARMAALIADLPSCAPGVTVNRLCGSGMEAVGQAARAVRSGEAELLIAGGVESMSRAPFVIGKADTPFSRDARMYDTTIGWRFINPLIEERHGVDDMPETAENVASAYRISREDQDAFAYRSHKRACAARDAGIFNAEITPLRAGGKGKDARIVREDEAIRPDASLEALAKLPTPFRDNGTITAGNASGINDGACGLLIASEEAASLHGMTPKARILGMTAVGVAPRLMGIGPAPATEKLLARLRVRLDAIGVIECNEAFAAQTLAVLRMLHLPDDAPHVNANGGAIALGHPLGMSGARLVAHATYRLHRERQRFALCTMCIGIGQGIALLLERVA
jgi:3-oxoadipyl-CoA thiolase